MNNSFLDKIKINLNSSNEEIKKHFLEIKKENELDKDTREQNDLSRIPKEEFKKYSETFSPYPFLMFAYNNWASDIQFLATDKETEIRFKIDWIWSTEFKIHRDNHILYVNALKNWLVKWSWNVSPENQKIPQDWKWIFYILKKENNHEVLLEKTIQLRFASAPQQYTDSNWSILETIVVRLLWGTKLIKLEDSWFSYFDLEKLRTLRNLKKWLILISWPTGSWKSTTLFNYIHWVNDWTKNIITFENPIEFDVPGVVQLDIKPIEDISDDDEITFNFERWKNFAMRAAPNVALVWEIRNFQTALAWVQLSSTWHITLATLHTNSTISTISRYIWFKDKKWNSIDKFDFISLLKYVSAQMLSPKLCPHCKIKVKDIQTNTWNELYDFEYKEMAKEIKIQKTIVKREILKPNVKMLLNGINEETVDKLIENSYLPNLHWCKHCTLSEENKIHPRAWRKWVVMLNESLIFDEYVLDILMNSKEISEKEVLQKITEERPLLPKEHPHAIKEKSQFFFTLYQDALLKALLPINNLKGIMETKESNLISILDAKEFGDPK